jgi:hypothetical protein
MSRICEHQAEGKKVRRIDTGYMPDRDGEQVLTVIEFEDHTRVEQLFTIVYSNGRLKIQIETLDETSA